MDTFIVSARKYRPQNFNTVVGQEHITTTLKNAILHNHLAHAFLFCGPRGVGKTTCARILAKTINCEKVGKDGEACNKCQSCLSFESGSSFNIHELDAASNNSVEDIRTLTEQVRFAPQAGKYKVYIVDEVHMLSQSAFNAFLKTLEEPPPYVIFILATTEKHKILPTILSRCQIFDFKRIINSDTSKHLAEICKKEGIKAENTALHLIAQKSEGCLRDALSILDKIVSFTNGKVTYANTLEHLNILDEDYYFRLIDFMQHQKTTDILLLFDEINKKGFEGDTLLEGMVECMRNILVSKDERAASLVETAEEFREKYIQTASTITSGWLLSAMNILNESILNYKLARNKRLFVEWTLIKLAHLQQAIELTATDNSIVKKKLTEQKGVLGFRTLQPVALKEPSARSASVIPTPQPKANKATVYIEQDTQVASVKAAPSFAANTLTETLPEKKVALGTLSKIREKISTGKVGEGMGIMTVNQENADAAWKAFIAKLEENKQHSVVSYFNMATVSPVEENTLEITVQGDFHKKFIDSERSELIVHLQRFFKSRAVTYRFNVLPEPEQDNTQRSLSSKEQYMVLSEKYPWVKALRERLKLEIDL